MDCASVFSLVSTLPSFSSMLTASKHSHSNVNGLAPSHSRSLALASTTRLFKKIEAEKKTHIPRWKKQKSIHTALYACSIDDGIGCVNCEMVEMKRICLHKICFAWVVTKSGAMHRITIVILSSCASRIIIKQVQWCTKKNANRSFFSSSTSIFVDVVDFFHFVFFSAHCYSPIFICWYLIVFVLLNASQPNVWYGSIPCDCVWVCKWDESNCQAHIVCAQQQQRIKMMIVKSCCVCTMCVRIKGWMFVVAKLLNRMYNFEWSHQSKQWHKRKKHEVTMTRTTHIKMVCEKKTWNLIDMQQILRISQCDTCETEYTKAP